MNHLRAFLARLTRRSADAALDAEIRTHLALLTDEYVRAGLPLDEARLAARRAFGGVVQVTEAQRDARRGAALDHLLADIRHGLRGLRRHPGFTSAAVLTLALGIAANAAIFGLVNALLLRPLPISKADRLTVFARARRDGETLTAFSPREFETLRTSAPAWSSVVAVSPATLGLITGSAADRIAVSFVSENYWSAFGLRPSLGTLFQPTESTQTSAAPVIVLAEDYWRTRFRSDPAVLGKALKLGGVPLTVIGVAPAGFHGDSVFTDVKAFVPLHAPGFVPSPAARPARLLGMLAPGVTLAQANATLGGISAAIARDRRESPADIHVQAYWERLTRPTPHTARPEIASTVLFGLLAALVLALACVNVAGLILIRTSSRRGEMAVRAALGATRARLAWHLLVETFLLVVAAGVIGLLLGECATIGLGRLLPSSFAAFSRELDVGLDWRAAAFITTLVLVVGVAVGVIPALRTARPSVVAIRHQSGSIVGERTRGRRVLMSLQVATALMLIVVAGLFARGLMATRVQSFGFERRGVFDFGLNPSEAGSRGAAAQQTLEIIRARVAALPGITSVALAQGVPMNMHNSVARVFPDALARGSDEELGYISVSPAYFETVRIPIRGGRAFSPTDTAEAPRVAIVNDAMAARLWPQQNAVGRSFRIGTDSSPAVQVVGVAANILNYSVMQDAAMPYFYLPLAQHPTPSVTLQVRSIRPPAEVFRDVGAAIRSAAPDIAPFDVETMSDAIDRSPDGLLLPRMGAWLAAAFGVLGLVLSVVGVYGVVAYGASQRAREMALRVALGASPRDIRLNVLTGGVPLVAGGLIIGAVLAGTFALLTANLYLGVAPWDPAAFGGGLFCVGGAALAACYVPARRAMRVDPITVLKES